MSIQVSTPWSKSYVSGKQIQITAPTPVIMIATNTTYDFTKWEDNSTNPIRTVTITANTTLTLTYTPRPKYLLTITQDIGGTVTSTPVAGQIEQGTIVTAVAVASGNYNFKNWIVNGVNQPTQTNTTYTTTMTAALTLKPVFELKTISLTVTAGANGTVTLPDSTVVAAGTSVTRLYYTDTTYMFTATPSTTYPGSYLADWKLNSVTQGSTNPLNLRTTLAMAGQTLLATFTSNDFPHVKINIRKSGTGTVNPYGDNTDFTLTTPTISATFTATNVAGWAFDHWELSKAGQTTPTIYTSATQQITIDSTFEQAVLTAVFLQIYYTLTINSTPISGVTITVTEMN